MRLAYLFFRSGSGRRHRRCSSKPPFVWIKTKKKEKKIILRSEDLGEFRMKRFSITLFIPNPNPKSQNPKPKSHQSEFSFNKKINKNFVN